MICRTLRPRSAWSCATNMFWDTNRATMCTTRAGAKSRSSCAHPKDSRPLRSTLRLAVTRPPIGFVSRYRSSILASLALILFCVFASGPAYSQIPVQEAPPPPPSQPKDPAQQQGSKIKVQVNLVVLHTTVLDDRGKFVEGLTQENFRVY